MTKYQNSNTTLVKVKFKNQEENILNKIYSNTTLVKVKCSKAVKSSYYIADSNTTLVKVKYKVILTGRLTKDVFKYNTC